MLVTASSSGEAAGLGPVEVEEAPQDPRGHHPPNGRRGRRQIYWRGAGGGGGGEGGGGPGGEGEGNGENNSEEMKWMC